MRSIRSRTSPTSATRWPSSLGRGSDGGAHSSEPWGSSTTSPSACSRRFPPAPSSSMPTRTSATTSTGCAGRPDEMLAIFDRIGIARSFSFCLDEPDREPAFTAANDRTLAYAAENPDRIIPFVRLDLAEGPIEEATRCLDLGARGIKLHPRAQKFSVGDERLDAVFALAVEREVPILIHGGRGLPPIGDHLAAARRAVRRGSPDHRSRRHRRPRRPGAPLRARARRVLRHLAVGHRRPRRPDATGGTRADPVRDGLPLRAAAELAAPRAARGQAVELRRGRASAGCSARPRRGSRTARRSRR